MSNIKSFMENEYNAFGKKKQMRGKDRSKKRPYALVAKLAH